MNNTFIITQILKNIVPGFSCNQYVIMIQYTALQGGYYVNRVYKVRFHYAFQ